MGGSRPRDPDDVAFQRWAEAFKASITPEYAALIFPAVTLRHGGDVTGGTSDSNQSEVHTLGSSVASSLPASTADTQLPLAAVLPTAAGEPTSGAVAIERLLSPSSALWKCLMEVAMISSTEVTEDY